MNRILFATPGIDVEELKSIIKEAIREMIQEDKIKIKHQKIFLETMKKKFSE